MISTLGTNPPYEIVELISTFIEPNPVVYTRLAMVNRVFHSVFTHDKLWRRLDANGVYRGVFKHFVSMVPTFERILVACWSGTYFEEPFEVTSIANKYVQLGFYLCCAQNSIAKRLAETQDLNHETITAINTNDLQILKVLIGLNPKTFIFFNVKAKDNEELTWLAGKKSFELIEFASARVLSNRVLIHRLVEMTENFRLFTLANVFDPSDVELFENAMRAHPTVPDGPGNPDSIVRAPDLFRGKKECIIEALRVIDFGSYYQWYQFEKARDISIFNDPDVIAVIVDRGFFYNYNYGTFVGIRTLFSLFDNYEWVKERIVMGPQAWTLASDRLQEDRELMLLALECNSEFRKAPKGLIPKVSLLEMDSLPHQFLQDEGVIVKAFEANGIGLVPLERRTKEMVREHLKEYQSIQGHFNLEPESYELGREAVLYDIRYIIGCGCDIGTLLKDPLVRPIIFKFRHVVNNLFDDMLLSMEFWNMFGNQPIMGRLDRFSAIELIKRFPNRYAKSERPWAKQEELLIEAVKADGRVFGFLSPELQKKKKFQVAIGPLDIEFPLATNIGRMNG